MTGVPRVLGLRPIAWILLSCLVSLGIWATRVALREARGASVATFDPRRLELAASLPAWLQTGQAASFLDEYLQHCGEPFVLQDDERFAAWLERLRSLPWIAAVRARRQPPNDVLLAFDLRRPRLLVQGPGTWLSWTCDDGTLIPLPLGTVRQHAAARELYDALRDGRLAFGVPTPGKALPAELPGGTPLLLGLGEVLAGAEGVVRRRAVAGIVRRFAETFAPCLSAEDLSAADRPAADRLARDRSATTSDPEQLRRRASLRGLSLYGIDASNESWQISRSKARYRLVLRSAAGHAVLAAWGHEPGSEFEEIPAEEKLRVLEAICAQHPGLSGVQAMDLRFPRTWAERLVPMPGQGEATPKPGSGAGELSPAPTLSPLRRLDPPGLPDAGASR